MHINLKDNNLQDIILQDIILQDIILQDMIILQDFITTKQSASPYEFFYGVDHTGSSLGIVGYVDYLRQNQKLRGVPNGTHDQRRRY